MKKIVLIATMLVLSNVILADNFWTITNEKSVPSDGEQKLFPSNYLLAKLDVEGFKFFQSQIPTEAVGEFPIIKLPMPNGKIGQYYIFETDMMAPGLAQRYPEIKTYTLINTENPRITGKADFTLWGFHAKVFSGDKTYFIDPYRHGNQQWYFSYYKKDYNKPLNERMQCLVDDEFEKSEIQSGGIELHNDRPRNTGLRKTFGTDKRTYRLALACTIEYSAAVAGVNATKAQVLSAMVTTMNRVNGVFERELSMNAQLINNTDDVIYLPGTTDPYSNNSGSQMLGQNHATLQSVIGAANYDFGHVFSTGGGGIASFASVCRNSKARGVTGSSNPVGDPFDIDYVAHEMGHQFGGSHTFNSTTGSCGGNGSSSSSFEPGSATTIMGYAGICGADNIQGNSDDYYHIRSLMQMSNHMDGNGNCATKVSSNNTPPSFTSINKTYTIPYKTFFELEADGSDADNHPITYCWEQWDLGAYGPWNLVSSGNPLFRSFAPTQDNVRVFPELLKVRPELIKTRGEVLPEVTRDVNFKLTVRDISNGYGSFNYSDDELLIQAVNTGTPLFRVTSHGTTGQIWTGDTKQTVTWEVGGTTANGINAATVDVYVSVDTGRTWPYKVADNVPNDGSQDIIIPNVATNFGLVKVKGHNNIFFDINNGYITIQPQTYPTNINERTIKNIQLLPNPSNGRLSISNLPSNTRNIELLSTNGQVIKDLPVHSTIDLSELSNGLYFLKMRLENGGQFVKKIVIQK